MKSIKKDEIDLRYYSRAISKSSNFVVLSENDKMWSQHKTLPEALKERDRKNKKSLKSVYYIKKLILE